MKIIAAGDTDVGRVRSANEDAVFVGERVFAVADGMGGAAGGGVASSTALQMVAELDDLSPDVDHGDAVVQVVRDANQAVRDRAAEDPELRGMGTTLTAAILEDRTVHIAHVGDSRAYLLRDGSLEQLTRDHSLVQELIDLGRLTPEEAKNHPRRGVITRSVGTSREVEVDLYRIDVQEGDRLLLCSDGLTGMVDERDLLDCLEESEDPADCVATLIRQANEGGGKDNVSAVVLSMLETA